MSTQIAVRLDDDELKILDAEVSKGLAKSRSDAVRQSIISIAEPLSLIRDDLLHSRQIRSVSLREFVEASRFVDAPDLARFRADQDAWLDDDVMEDPYAR